GVRDLLGKGIRLGGQALSVALIIDAMAQTAGAETTYSHYAAQKSKAMVALFGTPEQKEQLQNYGNPGGVNAWMAQPVKSVAVYRNYYKDVPKWYNIIGVDYMDSPGAGDRGKVVDLGTIARREAFAKESVGASVYAERFGFTTYHFQGWQCDEAQYAPAPMPLP
ncbi:MAG: hypothetical protein NT049_17710, partial [Planctomycetota bacterium]|nr:hypothetical protein [Planctomycetota bacterium]